MGILNLLDVSINFIPFDVETIASIDLNWMGKIVQWIINLVGIVGVGVIIFTLFLKTVMLPLDVYSRVKMKKQSLMMKKMRPQMEKLQKQYANDKAIYNQKVMELQKQNGMSMFGACLPMIVTLVIFMFVFSAFSTYSQYANLSTYNEMVGSYNASVQTYILKDYAGNTVESDGFLLEYLDESLVDSNILDVNNIPAELTDAQKKELEKGKVYRADFSVFKEKVDFDSDLIKDLFKSINKQPSDFDNLSETEKTVIVQGFVRDNARKAAADFYRGHRNNFLWVNNVWYPDSLLNKEVPDFSKFSSAVTRATGSGISETYSASYDEVTHYLRNAGYEDAKGGIEGERYNGYFVLIVLAIGLMFLQQFISMRSQKDANELGTVDGTGAKTNKYMLIMMPIIYGVFSFFYSAAFSLYMITNTLYGLIVTVIINKAMDASFAKQEANGGYSIKKEKKFNRKRLK